MYLDNIDIHEVSMTVLSSSMAANLNWSAMPSVHVFCTVEAALNSSGRWHKTFLWEVLCVKLDPLVHASVVCSPECNMPPTLGSQIATSTFQPQGVLIYAGVVAVELLAGVLVIPLSGVVALILLLAAAEDLGVGWFVRNSLPILICLCPVIAGNNFDRDQQNAPISEDESKSWWGFSSLLTVSFDMRMSSDRSPPKLTKRNDLWLDVVAEGTYCWQDLLSPRRLLYCSSLQ